VQAADARELIPATAGRVRFIAPPRATLATIRFQHPVFAALAGFRPLLEGPAWPTVAELDAALQPLRHLGTGQPMALVAEQALDDGDNYERRIFQRGQLATRADNWHDLFNALAWKRFPAIKSALNAAQVADMARLGLQQRSRRQYALTQFDEAGAIVVLREPGLLAHWDRHDWPALFGTHAEAWRDGRITLSVFGHALHEHALEPAMLLVAKSLVLVANATFADADLDRLVAAAIADGDCLADPQQLRPLPMAGIPGWHPGAQDARFFRQTPCFRPLRPGRRYPAPLEPAAPAPT
jgi:hypothetical protein